MKEDDYLQILKISSDQTQVGRVVFQQDNDPTHISTVMNEWIIQTRTSGLYKRNKSVPGSQRMQLKSNLKIRPEAKTRSITVCMFFTQHDIFRRQRKKFSLKQTNKCFCMSKQQKQYVFYSSYHRNMRVVGIIIFKTSMT